MNNPKISIIVPVYKVEPYLRKCLDSVVNQTYQNLQIILVDDGSPDQSGMICDAYAAQDSRVEVIHLEKNCGVSAARNIGLKIAVGDYIGWVDSDDWIASDMYEYLLNGMINSGADVAVCSRYEQYENNCLFRGWKQEQILDVEEALELLLKNDVMQNFLWDKLWRRDLFDGIVFPEGHTFEDIAVMHQLFERASKFVCLPGGKYYYIQRAGSIVDDVALENRINHYLAARLRYEDMQARWPQFRPHLEGQCVAAAVNVWCSYLQNSKAERERYVKEIREISEFSREHYKSALEYLGLGIAGKIVVRLIPFTSWWAFAFAWCLGKLYKWKHGRNL